jgi:hypothetical protein
MCALVIGCPFVVRSRRSAHIDPQTTRDDNKARFSGTYRRSAVNPQAVALAGSARAVTHTNLYRCGSPPPV